MQPFHYFFGWYHGQIWPNLLASAVCTGLAWLVATRKLISLHNKHQKQLHEHITNEFAKLSNQSEQ